MGDDCGEREEIGSSAPEVADIDSTRQLGGNDHECSGLIQRQRHCSWLSHLRRKKRERIPRQATECSSLVERGNKADQR